MKAFNQVVVSAFNQRMGLLMRNAAGAILFQYDRAWLDTGLDLSGGQLPFDKKPFWLFRLSCG